MNTSKKLLQTTIAAQKLGREAFFAGKMRVAGWEPSLPTTIPMMKAWLNGWDAACIEGMMALGN